jgi:hypothetical protein
MEVVALALQSLLRQASSIMVHRDNDSFMAALRNFANDYLAGPGQRHASASGSRRRPIVDLSSFLRAVVTKEQPWIRDNDRARPTGRQLSVGKIVMGRLQEGIEHSGVRAVATHIPALRARISRPILKLCACTVYAPVGRGLLA